MVSLGALEQTVDCRGQRFEPRVANSYTFIIVSFVRRTSCIPPFLVLGTTYRVTALRVLDAPITDFRKNCEDHRKPYVLRVLSSATSHIHSQSHLEPLNDPTCLFRLGAIDTSIRARPETAKTVHWAPGGTNLIGRVKLLQ